jgi:predicted enzyme related to lactoylglutathione lyase
MVRCHAHRDTPKEAVVNGELGYVTLFVPDREVAGRFYGEVLGWRYSEPPGPERGRHILNTNFPGAIAGQESMFLRGGSVPSVVLNFTVADVAAAVTKVRELGGEAEDPHGDPGWFVARCKDDQGLAFEMWQPDKPLEGQWWRG